MDYYTVIFGHGESQTDKANFKSFDNALVYIKEKSNIQQKCENIYCRGCCCCPELVKDSIFEEWWYEEDSEITSLYFIQKRNTEIKFED